MTYLPASVIGRWFHLYLILDLYSRKIVGWEVHDTRRLRHAAHLVRRTALAEGIATLSDQAGAARRQRLHAQGHDGAGDAPLAGRQALVLAASRERRQRLCRVAVPHRQVPPGVPRQGLRRSRAGARLGEPASCVGTTIDHRHSGIRYVSPAQRHAGEDHAILAARHALYTQARERNPARWSGPTRNWSPIGAVTLNPERDSIVKTHSECIDTQPLAA